MSLGRRTRRNKEGDLHSQKLMILEGAKGKNLVLEEILNLGPVASPRKEESLDKEENLRKKLTRLNYSKSTRKKSLCYLLKGRSLG